MFELEAGVVAAHPRPFTDGPSAGVGKSGSAA
jgi:hypothetical protein